MNFRKFLVEGAEPNADVLNSMLELEAVSPGLSHLAAHLGLGGRQVGFGRLHGRLFDLDLNLVWFFVELDQ